MRTNVYIDGFNLYYGCLKGSKYKWLNPLNFCHSILGKTTDIQSIKYFTARVTARPSDLTISARQDIYIRALRTIRNLEIIEGKFLSSMVRMRCANPPPSYVEVLKTEEKGSDVNLAVHLVADGFRNRYDQAVIVSNDSDLVEAIKIVRRELRKSVVAILPILKSAKSRRRSRPSYDITNSATSIRFVREKNLREAQFPDTMCDHTGEIKKPKEWT